MVQGWRREPGILGKRSSSLLVSTHLHPLSGSEWEGKVEKAEERTDQGLGGLTRWTASVSSGSIGTDITKAVYLWGRSWLKNTKYMQIQFSLK